MAAHPKLPRQSIDRQTLLMRPAIFSFVFFSIALIAASCGKQSASPPGPAPAETNPCSLITPQEVEAVQKSQITDTKSSQRADGDFRIAQCFYTATEFNKSINLALTQKNPNNARARTAREFWRDTFEEGGKKRGKEEREEEEEKERTPPKKIEGLGDDARWVSNRFGGVLYVLKADAFVSISIGGVDPEQVKIDKCKALAQKIVERM
jgi:hypothetical protein